MGRLSNDDICAYLYNNINEDNATYTLENASYPLKNAPYPKSVDNRCEINVL